MNLKKQHQFSNFKYIYSSELVQIRSTLYVTLFALKGPVYFPPTLGVQLLNSQDLTRPSCMLHGQVPIALCSCPSLPTAVRTCATTAVTLHGHCPHCCTMWHQSHHEYPALHHLDGHKMQKPEEGGGPQKLQLLLQLKQQGELWPDGILGSTT